MGIQDVIDWYESYSKTQREKVCCGVWPFAIPGWIDPFIECCKPHDAGYQESEVLYARGVIEQNKELKNKALQIKSDADSTFYLSISNRILEGWILFRPLLNLWGSLYRDLVMHNSNKVWFGSVGAKIAAFESGETPVVQLALSRARIYER